MTENLELSIIIPCLNESESLSICISKAASWLQNQNFRGEIIVADNGSSDGSQEIAVSCGAKLVEVSIKGYGSAIKAGIENANGKYIIIGDADDSYDFSKLSPFLEKLHLGYDLVMGCRMPSGGGTIERGAMPWLHRWVGNPLLSFLGRLLFNADITDFHCGLRAFKRSSILKLNLQTTGMEFASEMVVKACLKNLKIIETPITLHKDKRSRPPHLKTWHDGWRHLRFLLLYAPNWLFLLPSAMITSTGAGLVFTSFYQGWHISVEMHQNNRLLIGCMLLMTGFQIASFWIVAKIFSLEQGYDEKPLYYQSLFKYLNLEVGIITGVLISLIGSILMLTAFGLFFDYLNFNLNMNTNNQLLIVGVFNLILGIQILFLSFFLSILGIRKQQPASTLPN